MAGLVRLALALTAICGAAFAAPSASDGDRLFFAGDFAAAQAVYASVPQGRPAYEKALRQLGAIALYENRLAEAERSLRLAVMQDPTDTKADAFLAEIARRRGDFANAATWLRQAGRPDRAAAYEAFGDAVPYRISSVARSARIAFVQTDPLPAVEARVNGVRGLFLVDTGAAGIVLDPDFASKADVAGMGGAVGTFAGGLTANIVYARISQFSLSALDIADVPAILLTTAGLSAAAGGRPVAGVIGLELLARFRSTLDFPGAALVLDPPGASFHEANHQIEVPFLWVSDHLILAHGALNDGPDQLFFVDTGLAGFAFTAPASTLRGANIALPALPKDIALAPGQGPAAPFDVRSLSLGPLRRENLQGLYGPFPPSLEASTGVHIAGIVSHAFFRPYAVTFDFARMRLYLRKSPS